MSPRTRVRQVILGAVAVSVIASTGAAFAAKPASTSKHNTGAPSVVFVQPAAGSTLSGTVTASGSASDNSGLASVQVSVDGGTWTTAAGTSSWSASVNTAAYSNGAHTLYAKATDTSGLTTTSALSVSFANGDTTAPAVAFSAPAAGSTVSGGVNVTGTSSDNVSVASVAVQVDGGAWQAVSGTTSWSWSWNTAGSANGTHTLTARATDSSGNTSSASRSFTVSNSSADATPPSVRISSPATGSTVGGATTVSGSASDNVSVSSVAIQLDSGNWLAVSGTTSWSWSWNTAGVANGSHTLTARATDSSGNTSTTSVSVNVNNTTSSSSAPNTQGTWVSPEGVTITINSAGNWTISQIYSILTANALDLTRIGPGLTIDVQDQYTTQTSVSACCSGNYTSVNEEIWLQGVNSGFASRPDAELTHEYGHAWSWFWNYMAHNGNWQTYEQARWTTSDGSLNLWTDSRTNTSYDWQVAEIVADDYRLLFGDSAAISERPTHLNTTIPDPRNVPNLSNFLYTQWRVG